MKGYDITKLAHMARIYITEEEGQNIEKSFESIITYVDQIRDLDTGNDTDTTALVYNVARVDGEAAVSSFSHQTIMDDMPARDGEYLKVKKIL